MSKLEFTYAMCGICGYQPYDDRDEMNIRSRWWDPDDGWKFGSLCRCCRDEFGDRQPEPGDFALLAYEDEGLFNDENILTDEDVLDLIPDDGDLNALRGMQGILAQMVANHTKDKDNAHH